MTKQNKKNICTCSVQKYFLGGGRTEFHKVNISPTHSRAKLNRKEMYYFGPKVSSIYGCGTRIHSG